MSTLLLYFAAFWEPVAPRTISRIEPHSQLQQSASPPGGDFALQGPVALKAERKASRCFTLIARS